MDKKVVIAGGSGFIGTALTEFLVDKGYEIVILTRNPQANREKVTYVYWDAHTMGDWVEVLDGAYALINLTGKSVNCIYTKKNREEILASRLNSVRVLHEALLKCEKTPNVFIQASSLAIYGDTKAECDEDAPHGSGFSVEVCKKWEEAFSKVDIPNMRKVILRIGFALGRNGGALQALQMLVKYNLGGTMGRGDQYISWMHIDDLNEMFFMAMEVDQISGIYNATGLSPATNKEFMKTLRTVMGKGWAPSTPAFAVKIGAYIIMRADPSLALTGRKCIPRRFVESGFQFKYSDLHHTLESLI